MKKHTCYWAGLIGIVMAAGCIGTSTYAADPAPSNNAPAAASVAPAAPSLPYGATEVVKMYKGGIGKDILVSYVESAAVPFQLNADAIIYLQHLGVAQEVTAAMIRRDGELQKQGFAAYQAQSQNMPQPPAMQQPMMMQSPAPQPAADAPVVLPGTPPPAVNPYPTVAAAPAPQVVYPDYAAYPYYGYPYAYGPNVVVGGIGWGRGWDGYAWGWGWGRGRGGWGGHGGYGGGHGGFGGGHGGFGGGHGGGGHR
jgi:uncharacterized membrane protein YgcG